MTREEARLILQVYRPGGRDATDPQFAAALALVKQDPELAAWFANRQKFDALVSGGLRQVHVPLDLKSKILAGGPKAKAVEPPISFWWRNLISWRSPVVWAMAAVVLILLSFTILLKQPANQERFADYRASMIQASENETHHIDVQIHDMKQAKAWLASHQAGANFDLPPALRDTPGMMGCRVLDWHGQKVSMLCFMLKGAKHVDLFVTALGKVPDAPPADKPQFVSTDGMPTASWSHDGMDYLMVGHGDMTDLKQILEPLTTISAQSSGDTFIQLASASYFQKNFLE